MKYSILLFALLLTACSNSPVTTPPPNGGGETLLLDRTGITDSVHLDTTNSSTRGFINQAFNFPYDTIRIKFDYAGSNSPVNGVMTMREQNTGYFFIFNDNFTSNSSYQPVDTTYSLASFSGTLQAYIACSGNHAHDVWFAIRDLKIYGK